MGLLALPSAAVAQVDPCDGTASSTSSGTVVLIYNEFSASPVSATTTDGVTTLTTNDAFTFDGLAYTFLDSPQFGGVITVQAPLACPGITAIDIPDNCPGGGGGGGGGDPPVTVSATVHDEATLQQWSETGFYPAFLQQITTNDPISVADAVFDLNFEIDMPDGSHAAGTFRVRKSDGAIGVVALTTTAATSSSSTSTLQASGSCSDDCPGAGIFRPRGRCCLSQLAICQALNSIPFLSSIMHFFFPACADCTSCANDCCCCSVNNPCHSCDPCGLTWLFNIVGIGQ